MKYIAQPYHTTAKNFVMATKKCGLFLEMGLGKTGIVLSACQELMWDSFEVKKVLVLAPLRPALMSWPDEIEKWDHTKDSRYSVVYGKDKEAKIREDVEYTIISYSTLPWLHGEIRDNPDGLPKFDMVVYDESTYVKKQSSNRWKYCARMLGAIPRAVILTGTPSPNGLTDLWAQIYLIDGGARLFRNEGDFSRTYFMAAGYENSRLVPLVGTKEKIAEKIADIVLPMKANDYISMPDMIVNDIQCSLTPKMGALYDELEAEFFLTFDSEEFEANTVAGMQMKLRQFVQGFLYNGDGKGKDIHNIKLDVMRELAESMNGEPVLVAFQFKHEAAKLSRLLGNAPVINSGTTTADSIEYLKQWNNRELPFLLVQPASVAHGLNLQSGGNNIVHYGQDWNLEYYDQLNARLYRTGQTKPVFVHHVVMKNTIDEVIRAAQRSKAKTQNTLYSLLKEYKEKRGL